MLARHDQHGNVAEFRNLTKICQHVETRASVGQAHVEHCGDDRRRVKQLERTLDGVRLDASVPGRFQKSPRSVPDEGLIVEDEDGRHVRWIQL